MRFVHLFIGSFRTPNGELTLMCFNGNATDGLYALMLSSDGLVMSSTFASSSKVSIPSSLTLLL